MKKYRWTALLLALVLAAGVCAGCGKKQTDAPAQDNQIQTNPDEVTAVTYTNGTITLRFSLQDGRWCWSDDKTFPLDGSYITALLADVQGGPPISITEEDLESYGLGGVTKYIEITTAEKTVTYYLGDPCGDGSSYLSSDDDESTVYRAPDDLSARLDRSIYDMAQLPTAEYPEALQKHAAWAEEILAKHPELNADNVHLILQDEVGHVFAQVLADAGVYKLDEAGRAGFVRFLESVK